MNVAIWPCLIKRPFKKGFFTVPEVAKRIICVNAEAVCIYIGKSGLGSKKRK